MLQYLEASIIAFVADVRDDVRTNVRVADHANTIMLLTQPPQSNTGLLSAEHEIRMVLRHFESLICSSPALADGKSVLKSVVSISAGDAKTLSIDVRYVLHNRTWPLRSPITRRSQRNSLQQPPRNEDSSVNQKV
jgi:hypothetical protein